MSGATICDETSFSRLTAANITTGNGRRRWRFGGEAQCALKVAFGTQLIVASSSTLNAHCHARPVLAPYFVRCQGSVKAAAEFLADLISDKPQPPE